MEISKTQIKYKNKKVIILSITHNFQDDVEDEI